MDSFCGISTEMTFPSESKNPVKFIKTTLPRFCVCEYEWQWYLARMFTKRNYIYNRRASKCTLWLPVWPKYEKVILLICSEPLWPQYWVVQFMICGLGCCSLNAMILGTNQSGGRASNGFMITNSCTNNCRFTFDRTYYFKRTESARRTSVGITTHAYLIVTCKFYL